MHKIWTKAEELHVLAKAEVLTDQELRIELQELFGRKVSLLALRKKRQRMGLKKVKGRGRSKLENPLGGVFMMISGK